MSTVETPLFATGNEAWDTWFAKVDHDYERAWEGANLYDRYYVDTAILKAEGDIRAYGDRDGYREGIGDIFTPERREAAKNAKQLLERRYDELLEARKQIYSASANESCDDEMCIEEDYDGYEGDLLYKQLAAVRDEWLEHYLLPRLLPTGVEPYNDWVLTAARLGTVSVNEIKPWGNEPFRPFYLAVADIELIPLHGSAALSIIVPPAFTAWGYHGHCDLYEWATVDDPATKKPSIELYPSTVEKLQQAGLWNPLQVDDVELQLRARAAAPNSSPNDY